MPDIEVRLAIEGLDETDDAQVSRIYAQFDALVSSILGLDRITVTVPILDGQHRVEAVKRVVADLERIGSVRVVDLDLDLVDAGEIAARTGKSRQEISMLATGQRGQGFPTPFAAPGGHRVWTWASIQNWLQANRPEWADPLDQLSRSEQMELAAWLYARTRAPQTAPAMAAQLLTQINVALDVVYPAKDIGYETSAHRLANVRWAGGGTAAEQGENVRTPRVELAS